ncbi:MAG: protein kinase [Myxococcales bacterium]|nr:protein kinase [Myxococcales bacterium]
MTHDPNQRETIAATGDPLSEPSAAASVPPAMGSHRSSSQRIDPYEGQTFDNRYRIDRLVGEGGMGFVYLGRHTVIDKKVAVKVLRGDMASDHEMAERFLNEARSASSIGNPHIVDISDFGRLPDGATYFVMEYLDGCSLGDLIAELHVVPIARLLHIAKQIAQGLAAAHAAGIVHRDLKPDNVMLIRRGDDPDFVKVLDFGIAKVGQETSKLTRKGSVFGTPHYMSPEQAAGLAVDHRTDIYALGVMLYEAVSGRVPFDADNFMGILTQHMYKVPIPPRALVPLPQDIPPGVEAVVMKCLAKKSEERYQSMDALIADFDKLSQGMVPDALPEALSRRSGGLHVPADYFRNARGMPQSVPGQPPPSRSRPAIVVALIGASFAVLVVTAIFAYSRAVTAKPDREPVASASVGAPSADVPVPSGGVASASATVTAVALTREILVIPAPRDAMVEVDGKKLGTGRQRVSVGTGPPVHVVVSKAGYAPQEFDLDERSDALQTPELTKNAPAWLKPTPKTPTPKTPTPKTPTPKPTATAAPTAKPTATPASTAKPSPGCSPEERDPFTGKCTRH